MSTLKLNIFNVLDASADFSLVNMPRNCCVLQFRIHLTMIMSGGQNNNNGIKGQELDVETFAPGEVRLQYRPLTPGTDYIATGTVVCIPDIAAMGADAETIVLPPLEFTTMCTPNMYRCVGHAATCLEVSWISVGRRQPYHFESVQYEAEITDSYGNLVNRVVTESMVCSFEELDPCTWYNVRVRIVAVGYYGPFSPYNSICTLTSWTLRAVGITSNEVVFEIYRAGVGHDEGAATGPMRPTIMESEYARDLTHSIQVALHSDRDGAVIEVEDVEMNTLVSKFFNLLPRRSFTAKLNVQLEHHRREACESKITFETQGQDYDSFTGSADMDKIWSSIRSLTISDPQMQGMMRKQRSTVKQRAHVTNPCNALRVQGATENSAVLKWARGDLNQSVFGINFTFRVVVLRIPRGYRCIPLWFTADDVGDISNSQVDKKSLLWGENCTEVTFHGDVAGHELHGLSSDTRYVVRVSAFDGSSHQWFPWTPFVCFTTLRSAGLQLEAVNVESFTVSLTNSVVQEETSARMVPPPDTLTKFDESNWQRLQRKVHFKVVRESDMHVMETTLDVSDKKLVYDVPRDPVRGNDRLQVRARMLLFDGTSWGSWSEPIYFIQRVVRNVKAETTPGGQLIVQWPKEMSDQVGNVFASDESARYITDTKSRIPKCMSLWGHSAAGGEGWVSVPILEMEIEAGRVVLPSVTIGRIELQVTVVDLVSPQLYELGAAFSQTMCPNIVVYEFDRYEPMIVQAGEEEITIACVPTNPECKEPELEEYSKKVSSKRCNCLTKTALKNYQQHLLHRQPITIPKIPTSVSQLQNITPTDEKVIMQLLSLVTSNETGFKGHVVNFEVIIERTESARADNHVQSGKLCKNGSKGLVVDGLEPHTKYCLRMRPVMLSSNTSESTSTTPYAYTGHWSSTIIVVTARKILLSCDGVGQEHIELSWERPAPWLPERAPQNSERVMKDMSTAIARGIRKVELGVGMAHDFRDDVDACGVKSDSYGTSIYSIDMPYQLMIMVEGLPFQWEVFLRASERGVVLSGLREGFRYNIRIRQLNSKKKTKWSRNVTIQTLTTLDVEMISFGTHYVVVECRRQNTNPSVDMTKAAANLCATPTQTFNADNQDSDSDIEFDLAELYEVSVRLDEPKMFRKTSVAEYKPEGFAGGTQTFRFDSLYADCQYSVWVRVKMVNLWSSWERICDFQTPPLVTPHLLRMCEDTVEVRVETLPELKPKYSRSPVSPRLSRGLKLFQVARYEFLLRGRVLPPHKRQILRNLEDQTECIREEDHVIEFHGDMTPLHEIGNLLPDNVYTLQARYFDTTGEPCDYSRPLRFLTFPRFEVHTHLLGETFLYLRAERLTRKMAHFDLIEEAVSARFSYETVAPQHDDEIKSLEKIWFNGQYTLSMHERYMMLKQAQLNYESALHYDLGEDLNHQLIIYETKSLHLENGVTRNNVLTSVNPNASYNVKYIDTDEAHIIEFCVRDLNPDRMYSSVVRAVNKWSVDAKPWSGMWSDMGSHHTLRPVIPIIISISEEWAFVMFRRPPLKTLGDQTTTTTTYYQFQMGGTILNTLPVPLKAGDTRFLFVEGLVPGMSYVVFARTCVERDSDQERTEWSGFIPFVTFRSLPQPPGLPHLYECRDGYVSLYFNPTNASEEYAQMSSPQRRHSWVGTLDPDEDTARDGLATLADRHTFYNQRALERDDVKTLKEQLTLAAGPNLDRISAPPPNEDDYRYESEQHSQDYYEIQVALTTKQREFRRFLTIGQVHETFVRLELPIETIHLRDLQFRINARNTVVDECLSHNVLPPNLPLDDNIVALAGRRRSMYSPTVGWYEPPTPSPITGLTVSLQDTRVDLTWSYPSIKYHNQLYFSVWLQYLDMDAPREVLRVRKPYATLRSLCAVQQRVFVVAVTSFGKSPPSAAIRFTPYCDVRERMYGDMLEDVMTDLQSNEIAPWDWDWPFPNDVENDVSRPPFQSPFHLRADDKMAARAQQLEVSLFCPPRGVFLQMENSEETEEMMIARQNAAKKEFDFNSVGEKRLWDLMVDRGSHTPNPHDAVPAKSILRPPRPEKEVLTRKSSNASGMMRKASFSIPQFNTSASFIRKHPSDRKPSLVVDKVLEKSTMEDSQSFFINLALTPEQAATSIGSGIPPPPNSPATSTQHIHATSIGIIKLGKVSLALPTLDQLRRARFGEVVERALSSTPGITPSETPIPWSRKPSPRPMTPADAIYVNKPPLRPPSSQAHREKPPSPAVPQPPPSQPSSSTHTGRQQQQRRCSSAVPTTNNTQPSHHYLAHVVKVATYDGEEQSSAAARMMSRSASFSGRTVLEKETTLKEQPHQRHHHKKSGRHHRNHNNGRLHPPQGLKFVGQGFVTPEVIPRDWN
eukprot:PhF_6_TR44180/c0_g1_i2/m.67720